jgi:hypothetical protein
MHPGGRYSHAFRDIELGTLRVKAAGEVMTVAAVIVPCASRKRRTPDTQMRAFSLPNASQTGVINAWRSRLAEVPPDSHADDMYQGRGFLLARKSALAASAPLYVASAGLGLVDTRSRIPSYGISVIDRGDDSIPRRVVGKFDPHEWWNGVAAGPYSVPVKQLFESRKGIVLVALSRPYALMLGAALARLSPHFMKRLRIIGLRLAEVLPPTLHPMLMPYDERLEAVLPGTRADFAQRALYHFVTTCLPVASGQIEDDRRTVERHLLGKELPARPRRPSVPDHTLLEIIKRHLPQARGIAHLLATVRHAEGIACEQKRFARLYRMAKSGQGK